MRPADDIKKMIRNWSESTSARMDERVLADVGRALEQSQAQAAPAEPSLRRIIMRSPLTKLTAAAVIMVACVTCLFLWRGTGSGIALADVLTRIEQVTAYAYQVRSTITRQQTSTNWTSSVLISEDNGIKIISRTVDPNNGESKHQETYLLPQLNSIVFVIHEWKEFIRLKYEDGKLEYYREEYNDPRVIIKQILSCDHTSLGQSVIDGTTVEGFQTADPAYKGGFMGQADLMGEPGKVDVKIWVDVNTFLPVRSDEDIVTKKGTHIHEVSYDFRWNAVVSAEDFEPVIPEDYTSPAGEIAIPEFDEKAAITGLRLFARLAGAYPVNIDRETLTKESKKLVGMEDLVSQEKLSEDEKTRITGEVILLLGPAFFHEGLVGENKDPTYYGKTVGPDDADKVLLRWKLDDGQYRVIFGNLSIKNVAPEELAELEKP